jgi:UDP-GlcNAc:undecaprenyl-phosphate/decaprenyl-phosphate GlcNAc-1-phosphate transferase
VAVISGVVALAVTVAVTPLMAGVARRLGLVDRPGLLKVQRAPVPYLGGAAVLAGVAAGAVWQDTWWLVPPAAAFGLGFADDLRDLNPRVRLVVEALVGALAGVTVVHGSIEWALIGALCVTVLVNSVNLLDGLDGLAGAVCSTSAVGAGLLDSGRPRVLAFAVAGALLGFVVHNRPPARIYLGDGGSYLVGTALAVSIVANGSHYSAAAGRVAVLPLVVAVPLADTVLAVLRRYRSGQPLFAGDRSHVYDQLVARGWGVERVVVVFAGTQATLVAVALALAGAPLPAALGTEAATIAVVLTFAGFARPRLEATP